MRTRNRAVSTASALAPPGQALSSHHPALSLPVMLDTFGPLIFPLYKAALLRKRILLMGQAPVELACNFGKSFYKFHIRTPTRIFSVRHLNPFGYPIFCLRSPPTRTFTHPPATTLCSRGSRHGYPSSRLPRHQSKLRRH